jgi:hypothetical protein
MDWMFGFSLDLDLKLGGFSGQLDLNKFSEGWFVWTVFFRDVGFFIRCFSKNVKKIEVD